MDLGSRETDSASVPTKDSQPASAHFRSLASFLRPQALTRQDRLGLCQKEPLEYANETSVSFWECERRRSQGGGPDQSVDQ